MECQRLEVNISCVACRPILRRAPGRNRRRGRVCEKNVCPAILAAWLLWKEKDAGFLPPTGRGVTAPPHFQPLSLPILPRQTGRGWPLKPPDYPTDRGP